MNVHSTWLYRLYWDHAYGLIVTIPRHSAKLSIHFGWSERTEGSPRGHNIQNKLNKFGNTSHLPGNTFRCIIKFARSSLPNTNTHPVLGAFISGTRLALGYINRVHCRVVGNNRSWFRAFVSSKFSRARRGTWSTTSLPIRFDWKLHISWNFSDHGFAKSFGETKLNFRGRQLAWSLLTRFALEICRTLWKVALLMTKNERFAWRTGNGDDWQTHLWWIRCIWSKAERLQLKYNTVCQIHLELTEVKIDVDLGPGLSRR